MLLGARQYLSGGKRPPYDAEVEWLGSDGCAFIVIGDPKVRDANMGKLRAEVYWSNWKQYGNLFYAEYSGSAPWGTRLLLHTNNNYAYANWRSKSAYVVLTKNVKHVVTYTDSYADIDGTRTSWTGSFNNTSKRIVLFNSSANYRTSAYDIGARFYSFAVWDRSGNLILDLVPVRFTNGDGQSEGAMWDRVSGTLLRNCGTGAFTVGPDK